MPLLTVDQQQTIKPISANWRSMAKSNTGVSHYDQLAEEVQALNLPKLLGYALYQDIVKNPTEANNLILLDGGTFEDCNGNNVDFKGIRYQLAWFNFERYVHTSGFADTATGMKSKTIAQSENLRDGIIKREQTFANMQAMSDFDLMEQFLNENSDTYTLWVCSNEKRNIPVAKMINLRNTTR